MSGETLLIVRRDGSAAALRELAETAERLLRLLDVRPKTTETGG